jgi:hypothetical protein
MRLFASASWSPAPTAISLEKPIAMRTNSAAGRACKATSAGSVTRASNSELTGTPGLLGGVHDRVEPLTGGRSDGGRDRPLYQRCVHQSDRVRVTVLEHVASREKGTPKVAEHNHARAAVGAFDGFCDALVAGAEIAVRTASGPLDAYLATAELGGKLGKTFGEIRAVRHDYDPNHFWAPLLLRL